MPHFLSDLHLHPARPETIRAFVGYLRGPARTADGVYILGDLFDLWLGDELLAEPAVAMVAAEIKGLSDSGVPVFFMHGNRDFLVGEGFATATGATLLPDPVVIDIAGTPTILSHGDLLCTDDTVYQQFRAQFRQPAWIAGFLAQPLDARRQFASKTRQDSDTAKVEKAESIMDANAQAIADMLRQQGCRHLIHGHTHRPARHDFEVDGQACQRWVLADWHDRATWLESDEQGWRAREA